MKNISLLFVTVNPTLTLTSDTAYTICDSIPFVYQAESAAVGTGFSWNRAAVPGISNPTASGNINLINETLTNTSNIPIVVDYVFTMTIDTCSYLQNVHVTVNPSAKVDPVANKIYCNDVLVTGIPFSSNVTGAEYFWSGTLDIGFGTNGSGSIPAFDALNAGTSPIIDTVEVYAKAYLCDGPVYSFTITINPTPVLNSDADTTLCNNMLYVYQAESLTQGTTFSWVRPHINGINPFSNSGTNNFVNETLTNTTQNPITVEYIFSLTIDTCTNLQYLQVTVNPTPEMNSASDTSICDGVLFNYLATSSTSGTHFSWSRDSIAGIGNPAGTGDDSLINESIDNVTFAAVTVYYDFTLTYTNVVTCENHAILSVKVNPSPPLPSFTSLSPDAVPVTVCGGSGNINFNIDHPQGANGVTYLWTANPPDAVEIGNANNPNTVISFNNTTGQVEIKVIAFNNDSLGGCPDSVIQVVNVTTNPDSIAERKIILKQPGNVLVYPDNSMSIDSGYQWGYDLKMNDTILGPPQNIPGQVYQVFVPESKYLSGSQLDTSTYCFWVLLKRSDCQSKVYYNGPYAPPGKLIDEGTDAAIKLKTYPNPTTGSFNLLLTGNMYGSIETKIYNTLGEVIFITSFIKNNYESNETIKDLNLPNGVYYLELESSDHQKKATRMVVAH
ncbi:MAG: T9SS type A sorting domain-containing protein [Chitinophagaceae bacterium]|nr:T9SS type A sorting domain-containing protein [Chitinophagaceae bacterium]